MRVILIYLYSVGRLVVSSVTAGVWFVALDVAKLKPSQFISVKLITSKKK